MDLSVIIVSWNTKDLLLLTLDAILKSTPRPKMEIIVIDNASEDGSVEAVKKRYPDVITICNGENVGFARANNQGIRISRGRYIVLANSDLEVFPETLNSLVNYLNSEEDVGMVGPQVLNKDLSIQTFSRPRKYPVLWRSACRALGVDKAIKNIYLYSEDKKQCVDILSGCFWMVRREVFEQVGLLDEQFFMYAEDVDFCRRVSKTKWKVIYNPVSKVVHYGGASSDRQPVRFFVELYRANLQYTSKHKGKVALFCLWFIFVTHMFIRGSIRKIQLTGANDRKFQHKYERSYICLKWLLTNCPTTESRRKKLNSPVVV